MKTQILTLIRAARAAHRAHFATLTNRATSKAQKQLARKHGTPKAFAQSCTMALGEISINEVNSAIAKYLDEWEAAA